MPKAIVTLTGPSGLVKAATSAADGSYSFTALPPGRYTVRAAAPILEQAPVEITVKPGAQTLRIELKVAVNRQQATVRADAGQPRHQSNGIRSRSVPAAQKPSSR